MCKAHLSNLQEGRIYLEPPHTQKKKTKKKSLLCSSAGRNQCWQIEWHHYLSNQHKKGRNAYIKWMQTWQRGRHETSKFFCTWRKKNGVWCNTSLKGQAQPWGREAGPDDFHADACSSGRLCWWSIDPRGRKGKFREKNVPENLKSKARATLKVTYKVFLYLPKLVRKWIQTVSEWGS